MDDIGSLSQYLVVTILNDILQNLRKTEFVLQHLLHHILVTGIDLVRFVDQGPNTRQDIRGRFRIDIPELVEPQDQHMKNIVLLEQTLIDGKVESRNDRRQKVVSLNPILLR